MLVGRGGIQSSAGNTDKDIRNTNDSMTVEKKRDNPKQKGTKRKNEVAVQNGSERDRETERDRERQREKAREREREGERERERRPREREREKRHIQ